MFVIVCRYESKKTFSACKTFTTVFFDFLKFSTFWVICAGLCGAKHRVTQSYIK